MNQWAFVIGAYAVTIVGSVGLVAGAWLAMRRAEADLDSVTRRK